MAVAGIFDRLSELVVQLDDEGVKRTTLEALRSGASAQEIISKGLAPGMEAIGRGYEAITASAEWRDQEPTDLVRATDPGTAAPSLPVR